MLRPGIKRLMRLDVFRRHSLAREMEDELRMHLELRAEQYEKTGMTSDDAREAARLRFGSVEDETKEIHRYARRREFAMRRVAAFENLLQDIRFSLRTLGRQRGWTTVAVLTIALSIAANTAVFSVVNDLLLDPLRYPHRNELAMVFLNNEKSQIQISPMLEQARRWASLPAIRAVEANGNQDLVLTGKGEARSVHADVVSPTFAAFSGAHMLLGRSFVATDTGASAPPVAVLGEQLWKTVFGGDRDIVGKTIMLGDQPRTVVGVYEGVVRTGGFGGQPGEMWLPLVSKTPFMAGPTVIRIAPGFTMEQAIAQMQAAATALDKEKGRQRMNDFTVTARRPGAYSSTRKSILLLWGAVGLLMLIACANVAHLLLARGAARSRELAIRGALGAGGGRIARQLLTESLLLAVFGCIVGIGAGVLGLRLIVALRPDNMASLANAHVDARVVIVNVATALITGFLFGLIALRNVSSNAAFSILRGSVAATPDRSRHRVRSLLVITEHALSIVLLVGAMLLIRSVINLQKIDPGFDARGLYSATIQLPDSRYAKPEDIDGYATRLRDAMRTVPELKNATIASGPPTRVGIVIGKWESDDPSAPPAIGKGYTPEANVRADYFSVLGLPLVAGHTFDAGSKQRNEVIVSQTLAKQLWPGFTNVIGRRFREKQADPNAKPFDWNIVVGVAHDASQLSLKSDEQKAMMYFPSETGAGWQSLAVILRTNGGPPTDALRKTLLSIDPNIPPPAAMSVSELLMNTIAEQRFVMALLTVFAVLAALLSAIGLYGVMAYMVAQTTREIGVRIALGAEKRNVIGLVMRQSIVLAAAGAAIGVGASVWASRLFTANVYGVSVLDPASYVVGIAALLALTVLAAIAPSLRAVRVDPMVAMRGD